MPRGILVTGAAGFIGSHLAERLARCGDRVVGLDNFDPYYEPSLKRRNLAEVTAATPAGSFDFVEGDVRDADLLARLFARNAFDGVVHLAALAGVRASVDQAVRYFDVNVTGTIRLLDACVEQRVRQFVFASSSSVYGDTDQVPLTEDGASDRPLAPYPASKRTCELLGYSYHNLHGLDVTGLRFFTVYGPRNRPDMMASMLLDSFMNGKEVKLFGGGEMRRDWTYIDDIVQGIVAALDRPLGYEIINLGRGEPIYLREFVDVTAELTGRRPNLRDAPVPAGDVRETFASLEKARRLLGYAPETSVREGMAKTLAWFRATSAKT